jgi:hypothetical protein
MIGFVRTLCLVVFAAAAFAQQGTTPKGSAEEYPVHGQDGTTGIGAEYMVHSFSRGDAVYLAKDYLVVEVALFPAAEQPIEVNFADFALRVNGKKQTLQPVAASMVAASLTHPEWSNRPGVEAVAGAGNGQVIFGRPPVSRIPGNTDPNAQGPTIPQVPKENPGGIEPQPREKPEALVVDTALPDGAQKRAVSGFLYFAYAGRTASIKSLELVYRSAVLRLR